jgi:hypothetical protein
MTRVTRGTIEAFCDKMLLVEHGGDVELTWDETWLAERVIGAMESADTVSDYLSDLRKAAKAALDSRGADA